jgi:hypothetical protein
MAHCRRWAGQAAAAQAVGPRAEVQDWAAARADSLLQGKRTCRLNQRMVDHELTLNMHCTKENNTHKLEAYPCACACQLPGCAVAW